MKKRILVVDDEWAILELMKFRLRRRGFEVMTAKDEKEFMELALTGKPDLIILDVWLMDKIGTEIYNDLLNVGFDAEAPVIFITALAEEGSMRHAVRGGKYALYGKPFDFEELVKEIRRLLGDRSQRQLMKPDLPAIERRYGDENNFPGYLLDLAN